jgi:hypothetical protein
MINPSPSSSGACPLKSWKIDNGFERVIYRCSVLWFVVKLANDGKSVL